MQIGDPEQIQQYHYLWDGSQPGWVLTRLCGNYVDVTLKFASTGPSAREVMAVRRCVSEFKTSPLSEVALRLRETQSLFLGRFESKEARKVAAACRYEHLPVLETIIDAPQYLPTNELTGMALVIEDDVLAEIVYAAAIQHGIPIRHVEL